MRRCNWLAKLQLLVLGIALSAGAMAQNASTFVDLMSPAGYQTYREVIQLQRNGNLDIAQAMASELLANARENGDLTDAAAAQRLIGLVATQRHQYDLAEQALNQAEEYFQSIDEYLLLAQLNADLGTLKRIQGRHAGALSRYYNALSMFVAFEDFEGIAAQKSNIGQVLEQMGQFDGALEAYSEALEVQRQHNDQRGIAGTLYNMAEIYRELDQLDFALTYFEDALSQAVQLDIKPSIAASYTSIGMVQRAQKQYQQARQAFLAAIKLYEELDLQRDADWARTGLGESLVGLGETERGISMLQNVLTRAQSRGNVSLITIARLALTRVYIEQQNWAAAIEQAEVGLQEVIQRTEVKRQSQFEDLRVTIFARTEQFQRAYAALKNQRAIEETILLQRREAALTKLQSDIEYVRQEQNIALLRKNKAMELSLAEQRNVRNVTLLASLIILLLLCFLLFSRHSHKMRNQQLAGIVKRRTQELERKNEELQQAYRTLEHMSLRDALTGCYNRHYLDANLPAEINRSLHSYRAAKELGRNPPEQNSLLGFLIDIDDFKIINDTYGHVTGDKFLIQFAKIIAHVFRHSDLQVRWGGEEFLVICRNTMRSDAPILAERLRAAVSDAHFKSQSGATFKATCSIGFTTFPLDQDNAERISWEQSFQLADHCLYSAKASRKNCWIGVLSAHASDNVESLSDNERKIGLGRLTVVTSLNHVSAINWHEDV